MLEIFPHFPSDMIARDLRRTGSVQATVNNILSGHIQVFNGLQLDENVSARQLSEE